MTTNPKYANIKVTRLSPDKVAKLIEKPDIVILDVRPANFSRNNSFLANTVHIPLINIEKMAAELPKDRPILLTDWAMKQSLVAAKFLSEQKYTVIGVLKGGIERWKHENRPVVQKKPRSPVSSANRDFK